MKRKGEFSTQELVLMGVAVIAAAAIIGAVSQGIDNVVTGIIEKLL
ncbi:hypothetical protein [Candidatus Nanohalovita haloferacivicina]|nr:hypothetical protein HBNXNv_1080 [Candidatus Nanohalobia archaeon BNXNv]